jgi:hypothetical protein
LTVKVSLIFEKRFMVFKTVNRFPKLNYLSLHARLISDCQNSAIVGSHNQAGAGVRLHSITGNLPVLYAGKLDICRNWPEYCRIPAMVRSRLDLARNRLDLDGIRPDLAKTAEIRPNLDGSDH